MGNFDGWTEAALISLAAKRVKKQNPDEDFKNQMIEKHATKPAANANKLTDQVLAYLNSSGFYAWRNNNHGVFKVSSTAKTVAGKINWLLRSKNGAMPLKDLMPMVTNWLKGGFITSHRNVKGIADILSIEEGTGILWVWEIKHNKDTLKDEQKIYLSRIQEAGGRACVVKTLDDVIQYINNPYNVKFKISPPHNSGKNRWGWQGNKASPG